MRDRENEAACTACGAVHHRYPAKLCRGCEGEALIERADLRRAWRRDQALIA